ncbi:Alpha/Beta hydrolase protein [Bisporella sp. PMI_857]|nr:Alpha/Beta hydrolase protein [Bisporella sp. PMI_857]
MDLEPAFSLAYKEVDGSRILTDVFIPPTKSQQQVSDPGHPTEVPVIYVIHGGGWLMGHPSMNPKAQIEDSLERGWIVLAPDHRLCPQLNILDGPMADIRSLHAWVHDGHLDTELKARAVPLSADKRKIIATGSASGGHACLGLAFDNEATPPPAAILDLYAPKNFHHPWWTGLRDKLDVNVPQLTPEMEQMVFSEYPIPSRVDLPVKPNAEGKIVLPEAEAINHTTARVSYATNIILKHQLLDVCFPYPTDRTVSAKEHYRPIDPIQNVHLRWPPTCFVHGVDDNLLPHTVTTLPLMEALQQHGVKCKFVGIEGGKHMFVISMTRQSKEWSAMGEAMDWLAAVIDE